MSIRKMNFGRPNLVTLEALPNKPTRPLQRAASQDSLPVEPSRCQACERTNGTIQSLIVYGSRHIKHDKKGSKCEEVLKFVIDTLKNIAKMNSCDLCKELKEDIKTLKEGQQQLQLDMARSKDDFDKMKTELIEMKNVPYERVVKAKNHFDAPDSEILARHTDRLRKLESEQTQLASELYKYMEDGAHLSGGIGQKTVSRKAASHGVSQSSAGMMFEQLTTDKNDKSVHAELKKLVGNSKKADRELSNILMGSYQMMIEVLLERMKNKLYTLFVPVEEQSMRREARTEMAKIASAYHILLDVLTTTTDPYFNQQEFLQQNLQFLADKPGIVKTVFHSSDDSQPNWLLEISELVWMLVRVTPEPMILSTPPEMHEKFADIYHNHEDSSQTENPQQKYYYGRPVLFRNWRGTTYSKGHAYPALQESSWSMARFSQGLRFF